MTTTAAATVDRFRHEGYTYRRTEDFARDIGAFVREGVQRDEVVAVAETRGNIDVLRDELGGDARRVRFIDMREVGGNPARIIGVWEQLVAATAEGRGLRGVGEPAWPGRRDLELGECRLHELLLNTAFDEGRPWWLVCPYDASGLPSTAVEESLRTHPSRFESGSSHDNDDYRSTTALRAFAEPLPPAPTHAEAHRFDARTLPSVRSVVLEQAGTHGLEEARSHALVQAAWEVALNSVVHGGGSGTLRVWREPEALVCQVDDDGHISDPLVGRRAPGRGRDGGRGVYLANHLCDLVQLRSSGEGTTVRLVSWL